MLRNRNLQQRAFCTKFCALRATIRMDQESAYAMQSEDRNIENAGWETRK
jgi:hypothetical protein